MKTAKGTDCSGKHEFNHSRGMDMWTERRINGRRYTTCAHQVGNNYCGELIDVTDLPQAVICCGDDTKHSYQDLPFGTY